VTSGLAWQGATLWALLAADVVNASLAILTLYVFRPVWRPRLAWLPATMRYFLGFGSRNLLVTVLVVALDNVDNLWAGRYLGETSLGFYSRAYAFATYPRTILAAPINTVAGGTLAELKGDCPRLSAAFFQINAFLVRSSFFIAGLLALVAPEFIRLVLGTKWLPMLDAFRLMLVFSLLDPMRKTAAHLFLAVGKPEQIAYTYCVQLVALISGMFLLGPRLGIAGIALAVNIMLVIGMTIMQWRARAYVDISLGRLFAVPGLALILGMLFARWTVALPGVLGSDWRTGLAKAVVFAVLYSTLVLAFEWRWVIKSLSRLRTGSWG